MDLQYTEPKNPHQLVNELRKFNNRIGNLKSEVADQCNLDIIKSQDARIVFLNTIQANLLVCRAIFNLCIQTPENQFSTIIDIPELQEMTKTEKQKKDLDTIEQFLRLSFMSSLVFNVENFFSNIISKLTGSRLRDYKKVVENLYSKLAWAAGTDPFLALSYARNSLHNNGINRNDTRVFRVNEVEYLFEMNKKVECAGWHHILNLFDSILLSIQSILEHPDVKTIEEIQDDFAKEKDPQLIDA